MKSYDKLGLCINNYAATCITVGKVYKLMKIKELSEWDTCFILNDRGGKGEYLKKRFIELPDTELSRVLYD